MNVDDVLKWAEKKYVSVMEVPPTEEDLTRFRRFVIDMFSENNVIRALDVVREVSAWWYIDAVPNGLERELDADQPSALQETLQLYQAAIRAMNIAATGETMETWQRGQFYESYRKLRDQLKKGEGEVSRYVEAQSTVQGRTYSVYLVDEMARQLMTTDENSPTWADDRTTGWLLEITRRATSWPKVKGDKVCNSPGR